MGGGSYSSLSRGVRAEAAGTYMKSNVENFKSREVTREMTTVDLKYREARDSVEHPNSVPIIIALDVTGSMGSVPEHLIKHGLPHMMDSIIKAGNPDPQVLFMGIGDHVFDRSPLQVGQFESSDELLDKWLMDTYLEGGGGGNDGESYMLAWYFAARHTQLDCFEKREQKGFLFTIGDEKNLANVPGPVLEKIMGKGQYGTLTNSSELLEEARKTYNVYHIHISETHSGQRMDVQSHWKEILGDDLIIVQSSDHISGIIASIVSGKSGSTEGVEDTPDKERDEPTVDKPKEEEML